ncbi:MAG TPA: YHS domain-containing protein [Bryobacteraceae bacterium]|nr:YHS domain-containing protein [Bryobacteraceae bacterium]
MFSFIYRLILFFIAISVIQSVIQALVRAFRGQGPRNVPGAAPRTTNSASGPSESTLLHQDPVCGTYVAAGSSLRKISHGRVYHFCSEECRNKFHA